MEDKSNSFLIESIEEHQINVKDLKIGMYVSRLDRSWLETTFLFQGFELKSHADIEAVQKQCVYVFIDISKQQQVARYKTSSTPYTKDHLEQAQPPRARSTFKHEIKRAEGVYGQTSSLVKGFMEEVKLGRPINVIAAKEAVGECVDSVLNFPNALMLMTQLKNRDEYTAQHSMNVCIFAIALGRQINLPEKDLNNVGMCGLMHDMGKMAVPLEVLNKPGRLTPAEMVIMKGHAHEGWKILANTQGMYGGAIDVAHMHHERLDGKGYPRQLKAEQITLFTKIVAIVDLYDAVSSNRVYQQGRGHLEAIKILIESSRNGHLDPTLTIKFIECMGIYPAGSLVEMTTGEIALVIENNPKAKLKPRILMLQNADKKRCKEFVVDLSVTDHNFDGRDYGIKAVLRPDECGIDLYKYYQAGGMMEKVLAGFKGGLPNNASRMGG